jgi:hypothetical protein
MLSVLATSVAAAAQEEHNGTLVLKVDGKEVTLGLTGGAYGAGEDGKPDYFLIEGEDLALHGHFDVNGDGRADGADRLARDEDEVAKPASIQNKPSPIHPSDKNAENYVKLPGHGKMQVLKGSTFTVTNYKKVDSVTDRWSGTVKLVLKSDKGPKTIEGRFECGTGPQ